MAQKKRILNKEPKQSKTEPTKTRWLWFQTNPLVLFLCRLRRFIWNHRFPRLILWVIGVIITVPLPNYISNVITQNMLAQTVQGQSSAVTLYQNNTNLVVVTTAAIMTAVFIIHAGIRFKRIWHM